MPLHICPYFSNTMSSRRYSLRRVGTIPFAETDYVDRPVVYIIRDAHCLIYHRCTHFWASANSSYNVTTLPVQLNISKRSGRT